ncbi:MAG: alpha/beta hydrolase [Verrucomicrobiia bacterium]
MAKVMLNIYMYPALDVTSRRSLIVLHGLGDSKEGYHWLPEALKLDYLTYIFVDAPDRYGDGYSWFHINQETLEPHPKFVARSRIYLFQLLDYLEEHKYPVEQMVIFGFSQGCLMCWEIGVRYQKVLGGIIGISGWAAENTNIFESVTEISKQQRFLITHGVYDPLLPVERVREQIQIFKAKGLNIQYHEIEKEHTILTEKEIPLFRSFINKVLMEEPVNANVNNCYKQQTQS